MLLAHDGRYLLNTVLTRESPNRSCERRRIASHRLDPQQDFALCDEYGRLIGTVPHPSRRPRVGRNEETLYVRRVS